MSPVSVLSVNLGQLILNFQFVLLNFNFWVKWGEGRGIKVGKEATTKYFILTTGGDENFLLRFFFYFYKKCWFMV